MKKAIKTGLCVFLYLMACLLFFAQAEAQDSDAISLDSTQDAGDLVVQADEKIQSGSLLVGIRLAESAFLSPAPSEVRGKAYAILRRHAPHMLTRHTSEIRVLVPNVSCYGRFEDSLREHICQKFDWIHAVTAINTEEVRERPNVLFTIGTVAQLNFVVDKSKTPRDLVLALKESKQYQIDHWTVMVERPVLELLDRHASQGNKQQQ